MAVEGGSYDVLPEVDTMSCEQDANDGHADKMSDEQGANDGHADTTSNKQDDNDWYADTLLIKKDADDDRDRQGFVRPHIRMRSMDDASLTSNSKLVSKKLNSQPAAKQVEKAPTNAHNAHQPKTAPVQEK